MQHFLQITAPPRRGLGRFLVLLCGLLAAAPAAFAQTGSVGIGTTAPATSAALDVSSTSKGLLPPRLTQAQRDAIASPATGLTLYNTTTSKLNIWNGMSWDAALSATERPVQGPSATFNYTGAVQTYTVPAGVTSLQVDARAGSGGTGSGGGQFGLNVGGAGARVQATLSVSPGQVLQILVGAGGGYTNGPVLSGGYNGGGSASAGGTGGGATDLRGPSGALTDRLLVAGGGGGGGYYGSPGRSQGGAGGAPNGGDGTFNNGTGITTSATGGTQAAGGSTGGGLGMGGSGGSTGGGGGGGYYGGGGGVSTNGGGGGSGGGGSSWVTPAGSSAPTFTVGANTGDGSLTITPGGVYAAPNLDGSNFVNVPGDNLGNHTATQNLNLAANQLVGNGGSTGLAVSSTGSVGIGTTAPAASAALEVSSASKGLLPPRLTTAQRDVIASPAAGLTLYNTTTGKLNTWNGTSWDAALSATEQPIINPSVTFVYTGTVQTYTVPAGVTSLQVDAKGAAGGTGSGSTFGLNVGGAGARVQATLSVSPGQVLQILVGAGGGYTTGAVLSGGYNGGGSASAGGTGGGATDLRGSGGTLADRLLVAGGGGGGGYYGNPSSSLGGAGGAPDGGNGSYTNSGGGITTSGTGGTQAAGGSTGGGLGTGGSTGGRLGGGGGGGYYGGGGGGTNSGGGGGGSSWVTLTGISATAFTAGANAGDGSLILTPSPGTVYAAPVLDGSNFVNVPGDNLGNHTATQNLNLAANQLVGNGGSTGLVISSTGAITSASTITAGGNVQLGANQLVGNGGSTGLVISSTGAITSASTIIAGGNVQLGANQLVGNGGSTGLVISSTGAITSASTIIAGGNVQLGANQLVGNGGSTGLVISSSGSVGVGTASPNQRLDVRTSDGTARIVVGTTANTGGGIAFGNTGHGIQRGFPTLNADNNVGFYTTAGNLYLAANGAVTNQFVLTNGGNVGIGTSAAPATKLDVVGNVRVGAANTVGEILTNTTGTNNMLAVAYGLAGNNAPDVFGSSGNYTVTVTSPGVYTITFPASSGLNGVDFRFAAVNVSLYGGAPGFISYDAGSGFIRVRTFNTGLTPTPSSAYLFSFSVFTP
ncbi:beta strand repeat-containing protein [Hymenobacter siberiensis]|uniref:beta strand repeat-containing protein n=1 Tax=Hymenobacter siberiensis TaxID=2848396 RepID=UPI001D005A22|nr:glycine-rich protein [Hymenobacter siberiensis]